MTNGRDAFIGHFSFLMSFVINQAKVNVSDILSESRGWTNTLPAFLAGILGVSACRCVLVVFFTRTLRERAQPRNLFTQDQSVDIVRTLVGFY
jgi:hypothetical protein